MGSAVHAASAMPIVAIVDDDLAVRSSLAFALQGEGFLIRPYESAEELLGDPLVGGANCFIVDYKLPGQNGLELIEELRRRDVTAPAILITTSPNAFVRSAAGAAHVAIIEKPLLGEALFQELHAALSSKRSNQY